MAGFKSQRFIVGLALVVLALPAMVAAQKSSTLIVPFDRTGTPGTKTVTTIDPLTGQQTTMIVDTGAFVNPCTFEFVDVLGTTTIQTLQTLDKFGTMKVNVSEVSKGTGAGWVADPLGAPIFTGSTYAFNENQQFVFRLPTAGLEFASDFTDRLTMRGAKSTDNWTVRARFRIRIDAAGNVTASIIKLDGDVCKG